MHDVRHARPRAVEMHAVESRDGRRARRVERIIRSQDAIASTKVVNAKPVSMQTDKYRSRARRSFACAGAEAVELGVGCVGDGAHGRGRLQRRGAPEARGSREAPGARAVASGARESRGDVHAGP